MREVVQLTSRAESLAGEAAASDRDVRVLVVDDERYITDLVATALRYEGFEVASARNGREALTLVETFRPGLIVLDVMLPGTGGIAVLEQLRADERLAPVPVVVMTAWPQMEKQAFDAGASRFFAKPFEPEAMKDAVEELLGR